MMITKKDVCLWIDLEPINSMLEKLPGFSVFTYDYMVNFLNDPKQFSLRLVTQTDTVLVPFC